MMFRLYRRPVGAIDRYVDSLLRVIAPRAGEVYVLEGYPGVGKSTLSRAVVERMHGEMGVHSEVLNISQARNLLVLLNRLISRKFGKEVRRIDDAFKLLGSEMDLLLIDDVHVRASEFRRTALRWARIAASQGASVLIVVRSGILAEGSRIFFQYSIEEFNEILEDYGRVSEELVELTYPSLGWAIDAMERAERKGGVALDHARAMTLEKLRACDERDLTILLLAKKLISITRRPLLKKVLYEAYKELPDAIPRTSFFDRFLRLVARGVIWVSARANLRTIDRIPGEEHIEEVFRSKYPEAYARVSRAIKV